LLAAPSSADTFTVTNGNDSGAGSLRQAINDAEGNGNEPTADLIQITFTGNINLDSALQISTAMTIDGPGASSLNIRRDPAVMPSSKQFSLFGVLPDTGDTVTIRDLRISGARASGFSAGALSRSGLGTLVIDSVVFSDNENPPNGSGGAIHYDQGFTSIRNSTFTGNKSDFGGAILGTENGGVGGDAEIINSTITGNQATSFGGGVYVGGLGHVTILSSTIQDNTADSDDTGGGDGGGIYGGGGAGEFDIANTLLAGNTVGVSSSAANQCGSQITSFGYNLRETDDSGSACAGFTATGDTVDSDAALLGSLGSNGGPTPTMALLASNPAIDHGNPATPGSSDFPICPATDQRGFLRGGVAGRCDIGAFELNATEPASGGGGGGGPAPPPVTSGPTGLRAAAKKKCKKKFRHNAVKRKKCIKRAKRLPV
jgi:hypothetical protein